MRARHRLGKFLLRRGERFPGPGGTWTQAHSKWLPALRFDDRCSRATFADYLAGVELLAARRASLIAALEDALPGCSHAATIAALRCFRGIDTLSAAGLCAEVGDWSRFPKPKHVAGFLGIVPSEHTSDVKRRQGSITKAGRGHARQGRPRAPPPAARRGPPPLPPPARGRPNRRPPPTWPGPTRDHRRVESATTAAPALAAAARSAPQARRRRRDRLRSRARRLLLGGRQHPVNP